MLPGFKSIEEVSDGLSGRTFASWCMAIALTLNTEREKNTVQKPSKILQNMQFLKHIFSLKKFYFVVK